MLDRLAFNIHIIRLSSLREYASNCSIFNDLDREVEFSIGDILALIDNKGA